MPVPHQVRIENLRERVEDLETKQGRWEPQSDMWCRLETERLQALGELGMRRALVAQLDALHRDAPEIARKDAMFGGEFHRPGFGIVTSKPPIGVAQVGARARGVS